ncbi:MAG: glycine oxidase ThiO [Gammaproteobacteria bacterium]|nr:glycine oxidase ThiO [Gammaproteobacteria bacterium]
MHHHDCIVIGGGLLGLLTAHELINEGANVRLLERGVLGRESSWAGGGILSFLHPWNAKDALVPLADWSRSQYQELTARLYAESDIDPEYIQSGMLVLEPEDRQVIAQWGERSDRPVRELSNAEMLALEPGLGTSWTFGSLLPDIAQIRNPRLLKALATSLKNRGLDIQEHAEVREIHQGTHGTVSLTTRTGTVDAERVVVTSGAWSGRLLAMAGIESQVEPVRGQMLLFKLEPGVLRQILLHGDRYMIPRKDGHILMGSTVEYEGFDKSTTHEVAETLRKDAESFLPVLADHEPVAHWAGLRPGTLDGVPKIGPVPGVEGLFVNMGHLRNGVFLGPASARLLVDLMMGRQPICDPTPYLI